MPPRLVSSFFPTGKPVPSTIAFILAIKIPVPIQTILKTFSVMEINIDYRIMLQRCPMKRFRAGNFIQNLFTKLWRKTKKWQAP